MRERIFITVKTYPNLTNKGELVCTAGITESGKWIRVYPLPFRRLDREDRFKKYQWVTMNVTPAGSWDRRPESHRLLDMNIEPGDWIESWNVRKQYVLSPQMKVYTKRDELLQDMREKGTSLAIFKPAEVLKVYHEPTEREWPKEKIERQKMNQEQGNFLLSEEDRKYIYSIAEKIPYRFKFQFLDDDGNESNTMIEDWETGMLYRKERDRLGSEELAIESVKKKYMRMVETSDFYFFMGTSFEFQRKKYFNPFLIVGTFSPPKTTQMSINFD